jgi:plastocyanin
MADHDVKITSTGDLDPATLSCSPGDKITWTNNYSQEITEFTFNLPTCVSPQTSPAPIAVGATTRQYTVNNNAHGKFEYSYGWPDAKRGTRTGTIDVGSR